jgi:hypothetical protein
MKSDGQRILDATQEALVAVRDNDLDEWGAMTAACFLVGALIVAANKMNGADMDRLVDIATGAIRDATNVPHETARLMQ